VNQKA